MSPVVLLSRRAEKEFAAFDRTDQRQFQKLLDRIRHGDPNVQWKSFHLNHPVSRQLGHKGTLWEAKASGKLRLITNSRLGTIHVLGFYHRGQKGLFRFER